ncbi:MAG TPA: sugar phosphate nucleotidyltransferase, partial [Gaiellaceae bacterium]|nr:sugar phosphate nucleotidyltransferase [Gaiellaceae bacterium]
MKTVILAGGMGTRLAEETEVMPKPMVEIGGPPILWHIMKIYSAFGFNEFVLALGYKAEIIKSYFLNYYYLRNDFSLSVRNGDLTVHDGDRDDWVVHLIDTGTTTQTGGRVKRLAHWIGDDTFMLTYGDGVANIDLGHLIEFHKSHGKLATVTA